MSSVLWRPTADRIGRARATAFIDEVNSRFDLALSSWDELYAWSVRDPARFWEAVWRFCSIIAEREWEAVLSNGDSMPGARWFPGARLNYARNLLRFRDDGEALIFRGEGGRRSRLTHEELYALVARIARALRNAGVERGDRVAGFLPNIPEAVAAMLATASIGAVWSSCSPDFGAGGVLDRFGQIEPKVLIAADGYIYNGKRIDVLGTVSDLLDSLPAVEQAAIVPFLRPDPEPPPGAVSWERFLGDEQSGEIEFASLPFDHPLYIMYSSGTTGLPKCMVHSAGGTLIQHLKEHVLHGDLGIEDRIFYYTTCGWMMWNWLVSALAAGAAVMLYDGAPFAPPAALWDFAAEERITQFGTSARYIATAEKEGLRPAETHDLGAMKAILSTGSPLAPASFDYVYEAIKPDVRLSSISGGTDIISCFALGSPLLAVRRGELQCRGLGMGVAVVDESGRRTIGEKGELVCTAPFPSMPISFWNDPEGSRYRSAYFERFPGMWCHGDFAELRPEGGMVIHGRSDAVLNPGGIRIGTGEIYRIVERFDEVLESVAVGQEWENDVRIILCVRLRKGMALDSGLRERIRAAIRADASPRHVPARIVQVPDIPRTISGKVVELAVADVIHGRMVQNRDALANPEALDHFMELSELAS
jgi:acetoacetyl-CoA synthetase